MARAPRKRRITQVTRQRGTEGKKHQIEVSYSRSQGKISPQALKTRRNTTGNRPTTTLLIIIIIIIALILIPILHRTTTLARL